MIGWISRVDHFLLNFMNEFSTLTLAPKCWYVNFSKEYEVSHEHIKRRLRLLKEAGLVEEDPDHYYTITELGERYCAGDLSPEKIGEIEPDRN